MNTNTIQNQYLFSVSITSEIISQKVNYRRSDDDMAEELDENLYKMAENGFFAHNPGWGMCLGHSYLPVLIGDITKINWKHWFEVCNYSVEYVGALMYYTRDLTCVNPILSYGGLNSTFAPQPIMGREFSKMLLCPVISIHSHPKPYPPSLDDFEVQREKGWNIVVVRNGLYIYYWNGVGTLEDIEAGNFDGVNRILHFIPITKLKVY